MTSISCLALIVYMEARGESELTQRLVASVVIERARQEKKSICESMKVPRSYSWMWDGKSTNVDNTHMQKVTLPIVKKEISKPTMRGRVYFNECSLGKLWKSRPSLIKSGKLCFY